MAEAVVATGAVIPVWDWVRYFDLSSNATVVLAVWPLAGHHLSLIFSFLAKDHLIQDRRLKINSHVLQHKEGMLGIDSLT